MRKKLLWLPMLAMGLSANMLHAQEYEHLNIASGLNADVIANGFGAANASTTFAVDNANYAFMSTDFQVSASTIPPAYALPATGLINSAPTPGLTFQLAPYTGNNSLRIATASTSGTLTFSNQVSASKLYLLATSGSGTATITGTITFTDNSTQPITSSVIPDWFFSNALPVASSGFGRVNRLTNVMENPVGDPRLYQLAINILPANQAKLISSISFTKTSTAEGVLNIFAITAEELGTCPSPTGLLSTSTANSGIITWTPPVILPGINYEYYYSTSSTPPTATTTASGTVAVGTNTVTIPSLATGQQYYVWIRSNCGAADKGPWVMTTFTTGQITSTYTTGDISTMYNNTPSITSTTTCPGTLSVTVPAGYEISSVSTAYTMTTALNGWKSEQRSLLVCTTTNTSETALSSGTGDLGGTQAYSRSGLTIANGATGTVNFELRAWRTFGDTGCGVTYNKVDANSWTITVTYAPVCVPPVVPATTAQQVCQGSPVSQLTATGLPGATFKWYLAETGGTALAANAAVQAGTYWVSQTVNSCESARVPSVITITTVPAPTVDVTQSFCTGATVADLEAEGTTGGTLQWSLTSGGAALPATTPLIQGTYYLSQHLNGCHTAGIQVAVTVSTPTLPTALPQTFCAGATVADLTAQGGAGSTMQWSLTNGGSILAPATALQTGMYYVRASIGDCVTAFVSVMVTVNAEVPVVTTNASQTLCGGSTVADLTAEGANTGIIKWSQTSGGAILPATTTLQSGTYYVMQTVGNCDSDWTAVNVTINTVAAVSTNTTQSFCSGATVTQLSAQGTTGGTIQWSLTQGGTVLTANMQLAPGTYYVRQLIGNCGSTWTSVNVVVNELPVPVITGGTICVDAATGNVLQPYIITTGLPENFEYFWYKEGLLISGANGNQYSAEVEGSYSVMAVNTTNCASIPVEPVIVTESLIAQPTGEQSQEFMAGGTVDDLTVVTQTGAIVNWYIYNDMGVITSVDPSDELIDGETYYVTQTINGCESEMLSIVVSQALGLSGFGHVSFKLYPNPVSDILNISLGNEEITEISVINLLGQKVLSTKGGTGNITMDVSQLEAGTYIVQISTGSGKSSMKIIKQ